MSNYCNKCCRTPCECENDTAIYDARSARRAIGSIVCWEDADGHTRRGHLGDVRSKQVLINNVWVYYPRLTSLRRAA